MRVSWITYRRITKERTSLHTIDGNKAVLANYARDLRLSIPQKIYDITRKLKSPEEVERYFPGFLAFTDLTEQQIPRPVDRERRKIILSQVRTKDIL